MHAAKVNGVAHSAKPETAVAVRSIQAEHAVARWGTMEGGPTHEQAVLLCDADSWPEILADRPEFSKCSVLTFGSTIVALFPIMEIKSLGSPETRLCQ